MNVTGRTSAIEAMIASLDISPTDYELARNRYQAVGSWLEAGDYESGAQVEVYLQGSFRLGTVVRPFLGGKDADFDIDQVCEIACQSTDPRRLKNSVGDRLKKHADYGRMLNQEGKRCWTIEYASADGRPGFHMDVLPSRTSDRASTGIHITHKENDSYSWRSSDPKGYYRWFCAKNTMSPTLLREQMDAIYSANRSLYASVEDVPTLLARTSLQRAVQAMKRHRDVCFNGIDGAPISVILTTICAHQYRGGDVLSTLRCFVDYVAGRLAMVEAGGLLQDDGILDFRDGAWVVRNPADAAENFADKWAQKPELARNFFAWVYQLRRDLEAFEASGFPPDFGLALRGVQSETVAYGQRLLESMSSGPVGSSQAFLNLIHQGIEGRVGWDAVREVAARNVRLEERPLSKDVAWVNLYQVKIHSGEGLSEEDRTHIRSILNRHSTDADFVYCCNLLLGTATATMLRDSVSATGEDVLRWPITRLADRQVARTASTLVPAAPFTYAVR